MRGAWGLAAVLAALLGMPSSAGAQGGPVQIVTYDVSARGSMTIDWSERSGPVGTPCRGWTEDTGSGTQTFRSRRSRAIVVSTPSLAWKLEVAPVASTKRTRSWTARRGGDVDPGCPAVCPTGTTARAADGTCNPANPYRQPPNDCGTRTTAGTPMTIQVEPREEDDDDLQDLLGTTEPPGWLTAGPLRFATGYRTCRIYGESYLLAALPIRLSNADIRAIKRLAKGRTRTFRATRTNIDCADPDDRRSGTTCSLDFDVQVTIRRVR
jgi:hypothetical protein